MIVLANPWRVLARVLTVTYTPRRAPRPEVIAPPAVGGGTRAWASVS